MPDEQADPLDGEERGLFDAYDVAADLARRCRVVENMVRNKNTWTNQDVLSRVVNFFMTELWDNGFSQTEIRKAFVDAVGDMDRYAAGEERRS
jgi:methionine salvage enolase-phosphatase E1